MLALFNQPYTEIPIVFLDTETTGTHPGRDAIVQLGLARFEAGAWARKLTVLANPGRPIPPGATEVHGITDSDVAEALSAECIFARDDTKSILDGAQLGAYNAPFDKAMALRFVDDWTWPWLDPLTVIRAVDRFARGKGRHKLSAACERYGVELESAHDAGADARAAGELFYKTVPLIEKVKEMRVPWQRGQTPTLGQLLRWQQHQEVAEWWRFNEWLSKQPPMEDK